MTEPECLGPCEPGTAVTLEGIVWHETEGGSFVFLLNNNTFRSRHSSHLLLVHTQVF